MFLMPWRIWSFFAEVSLVRALLLLAVLFQSLASGLVVVLPFFGMSLLVVLRFVRFVLTLGLGMVRLFIFLRILLFQGSLFSVVGLVVFYPFWMVFIGMALLCPVIWSFLPSGDAVVFGWSLWSSLSC